MREAMVESPWERLIGGGILGSEEFSDQPRDRVKGRMKLTELSEVAGGIDYAAIAGAIRRLSNRLAKGELRTEMKRILSQLSNS